MSIFNGQSALDIVLETNIDLSAASSVGIEYLKPDGTEGSWTGVVDTVTTRVKYTVNAGDINVTGRWQLQAVATIGGKKAYGEIVKMIVSNRIAPSV